MSPRSSDGGHVDLDRVARGRREGVGRRPLEADDRRRRGVGRGRQQVRERARDQLVARRRRSTCSRPNPNVTVSRVERIAPPVLRLRRGGHSRASIRLLAQRLVGARCRSSCAAAVGDFARGAAMPLAFCVRVVARAGVRRERRHAARRCSPVVGATAQPVVRASRRSPSPCRGRRRRGSSARCRWRCRASAGTPCPGRSSSPAVVRPGRRSPNSLSGVQSYGPVVVRPVPVESADWWTLRPATTSLPPSLSVVAQLEHRLVGPARQLAASRSAAVAVDRRRGLVLRRVLRDEVVARVVEDRVEVREHAEVVGYLSSAAPVGGRRAAGRRR